MANKPFISATSNGREHGYVIEWSTVLETVWKTSKASESKKKFNPFCNVELCNFNLFF